MRCETCQGIGKVTYDQHPEPKPEPFGSVFPCPPCSGRGYFISSDEASARGELHYDPRITEAARKSKEGWK